MLFFTISKSKLPGYILPAIPVIACLIARACGFVANSKTKAFSALISALILAAGCILAGLFITLRGAMTSFRAAQAIGWVLAAFALGNLLLGSGDWLRFRSGVGKLLMPCSVVPVLVAALAAPRLVSAFSTGDPSGKALAAELTKMDVASSRISTHRMNRAKRYSLSFYLHREVPEWDSLHPTDGYILESSRLASLTHSGALEMDPKPIEIGATGYFLYRVRYRSLDAAGGGETK